MCHDFVDFKVKFVTFFPFFCNNLIAWCWPRPSKHVAIPNVAIVSLNFDNIMKEASDGTDTVSQSVNHECTPAENSISLIFKKKSSS
jgi:hypothetical protein